MFLNEFRLVEGCGNHNEKCWEVQRKYKYLNNNGDWIYTWALVFHSVNKKMCEEILKKYNNKPPKDYRIDFEDSLKYFN